ncbi:cytochrome c biogenesis protein CcsA [Cyclobacterium amurskyense]|uniref:cytochrome c biogenesis protein CcsA n=1 Tax=Cyclobacterium amurskyense TaxID=320787 RepID=UPI0030DAB83B|tara:strand:- start:77 stop:3184 length:3108 start_codon:yes stop_codon:yes gene_type:complete
MKFLLSTKVSVLLLFILAVAMGIATFVENDHGTAVARALFYEAWWFELIMIWLCINFIAHIGQYKLLSKEKLPLGIFHLAFIVIIIGAGVTRLFSKEGVIHIRTGNSENIYYTSNNYLQIEGGNGVHFSQGAEFTSKTFDPSTYAISLEGQDLELVLEEYVPSAKRVFAPGNETILVLSYIKEGTREDQILRNGESLLLGDLSLEMNENGIAPLRIYRSDSGWMLATNVHLQVMEMASQQIGVMHTNTAERLKLRSLYQWERGALVVRDIKENVSLNYVPEEDLEVAKNYADGLKMSLFDSEKNKLASGFFPKVSYKPSWVTFEIGEKTYHMTYGPKAQMLPFSLHLNTFELKRYPGSQSPESYASEVMVQDNGESWPYRIFMNNVLDHRGYRFYQSSYDADEQGTVLTINQDKPGTYLTYLGYLFLGIGMLLTLFAKNSRFNIMQRRLGKLSAGSSLLVLLSLFSFAAVGQENVSPEDFVVPKEKAEAYGRLIVQDLDGRMKPLNTLANEITRKLCGKAEITIRVKDKTLSLSPEQFLLAVQLQPEYFSRLPLIKIDQKKFLLVFKALKKSPVDQLSFMDFVDEEGNYLLSDLVEKANLLKPSERNEGHKELLKTDERFNIFYAVLIGDFLKLYPNRLDNNQTWYTSSQFTSGFEEEDAIFVQNIGKLYLSNLKEGLLTGNWEKANETFGYIDLYQREAGKAVYPSEAEIEGELLFNKLKLGNRLFGYFWLLGLMMLGLAITALFYSGKSLKPSWKLGVVFAWIGWVIFTFHLSLRWYIAKHPPWSDGFEMLVFVAWGVLLFGLVFGKKSHFTVPLGLLFSGTLLFVSFLDWLNPEITNLMPVLHSYWLKIHVAIIVSGYAPLALSAIIALLSLCLLVFKPKSPNPRWWLSMKELIVVNELSITVGLFLLTIGTFLGGVWANESWGRYWAWDPKETWALISVLIYAVVLHLRLIPGSRNAIIYNLASLWAFSAIIMTSFGVNYYLSGLHSYAKGDPVPVPYWVYVVTIVLLIVSITAYLRFGKLTEAEKRQLMI